MTFDNKLTMPVLLIAVTLTLMLTFQTRQILAERAIITQNFNAQEEPLAQVQQVSAQFESLAVGTARLAGEGNRTGQELIANLKRIGINVNPNATPGQSGIERIQPETAAPVAPVEAPAAE